MARTIPFLSVVHGVATRMGMDPATGLNVNDARAIVEYINTAHELAWTFYPWPEARNVEEVTPTDQVIAWDDTAEEIGEVFGVFTANPDTSANPLPLPYRLNKDGVVVAENAPATVWIEYRPPARIWTPEDATGGEEYPAYLAQAVMAGAYAQTLQEEGQHDTANSALAAMQSHLEIKVDLFERQSMQPSRFAVNRP